MLAMVRSVGLYVLGGVLLCGCTPKHGFGGPHAPDAVVKIGLLEQVEDQQARIEALEMAIEELWWRSEQTRIDVLEWEIDQLARMSQQERIEMLERKVAQLRGR